MHGCMDARKHAHTPNQNCNNYVLLTHKRVDKNVGGATVLVLYTSPDNALYLSQVL